jgi:phosphoserine phosphatase RsbU/P
LGVFPGTEYDENEIAFGPGDRLVLITDGISEASNNEGEDFGEERLIQLLLQYRNAPAAELQQAVLQAVASFAGEALQDDATLMILSMR